MESVVETSRGWLRGVREGGLFKFRGVPYARAPVGALRFRPPQPPEPWPGELDATRFGPAAPQGSSDPLPLPNDITRWSEDCLRLNVWTPGLDGKRAVMVWFHGGAFVRGTASRPTYDRGTLPLAGDVVFVSVEYRLGVLGFLHLDGLCGPDALFGSNLGIRDQLLALAWVREEIAAFGGDPANVTAFGHSAGAVCIGATLGMPAAERGYRRVILQSGPPTAIPPEAAEPVGRAVLQELGLTTQTAERLRDVPIEAILAAHPAAWNSPGTRPLGIPFAPVIDGDLLKRHPLESLAAGAAPDLDVVAGTTADEMRPYLVLEPDLLSLDENGLRARCERILPPAASGAAERIIGEYRRARSNRGAGTSPCDLWLSIQADRFVRYGSTKTTELASRDGGAAYSYLFSWESPFMNGLLGAFHELELQFLFGSLDDPITRALTGERPERERFARQLQDAWTGFAHSGAPASSWPRYDEQRRATRSLDVECTTQNAPLDDERRVWEEVLELRDC